MSDRWKTLLNGCMVGCAGMAGVPLAHHAQSAPVTGGNAQASADALASAEEIRQTLPRTYGAPAAAPHTQTR